MTSRHVRPDSGFTLIELLIVVAIIPLILGSLALGLVAVFKLQGNVAIRLGNAGDTQAATAVLNQDVTSAQYVTTNPLATSPSRCGVGTQALGLEWDAGNTVVSYNYQSNNSTNLTYNLARDLCIGGVQTQETIVAFAVLVGSSAVNVTCNSVTTTCASASSWIPATGVSRVAFVVSEPSPSSGTPYTFTLTSAPETSNSTDQTKLGAPTSASSCNFALPGTGTYASSFCFIDFANLNVSANYQAALSPTGLNITEAVPGGYTMSFNLKISGATISAVPFPTYSAAFLGNDNVVNGSKTPFYTGVGCANSTPTINSTTGLGTPSCTSPALYQPSQSSGGTTTVTFSNIAVVTSQGTGATGYEVVAADSETTDPAEYITFTSNLKFSQIPDSSTSAMGNACNKQDASGNPLAGGTDLTPSTFLWTSAASPGTPSSTVQCQSTWQEPATSPRTGALLLGLKPTTNGTTTLTATFHGAGLQGVAFGLLTPGSQLP